MDLAFFIIVSVLVITCTIVLVRISNSEKLSFIMKLLISIIILALTIVLAIGISNVFINIELNQIDNSMDISNREKQQVTARVISKEASYTREGSLTNYTVTYHYYVEVVCSTEDGVFYKTFDDVDLYENLEKGDTLEVILVIYKNNDEIYWSTMNLIE